MDLEQIIYMRNLLDSPINANDSGRIIQTTHAANAVNDKRHIRRKMREMPELDEEETINQAKSHINREITFKVFVASITNNVCTALFMDNDYSSKKIIKELYQAYAPEFMHMIKNKFTFLVPRTRTMYFDQHGMPCIMDRCINQICKITMKPGIFKVRDKHVMHLNVIRMQL